MGFCTVCGSLVPPSRHSCPSCGGRAKGAPARFRLVVCVSLNLELAVCWCCADALAARLLDSEARPASSDASYAHRQAAGPRASSDKWSLKCVQSSYSRARIGVTAHSSENTGISPSAAVLQRHSAAASRLLPALRPARERQRQRRARARARSSRVAAPFDHHRHVTIHLLALVQPAVAAAATTTQAASRSSGMWMTT